VKQKTRAPSRVTVYESLQTSTKRAGKPHTFILAKIENTKTGDGKISRNRARDTAGPAGPASQDETPTENHDTPGPASKDGETAENHDILL
jgi:hypothetical protein